KWGLAYLEATLRALNSPVKQQTDIPTPPPPTETPSRLRHIYWGMNKLTNEHQRLARHLSCPGKYPK
ncbi:MAG: hypothetical protein KAJ63_00550, partial [Methyloprofundus sp.]|nr:hypothetical protein [Methyloprofundus sp.]